MRSSVNSPVSDRLERLSTPEPFSGCLLWTGSVTGPGYGQLRVNGKIVSAHRASYECHVGHIPTGLDLDHLCRTGNPKSVSVTERKEQE